MWKSQNRKQNLKIVCDFAGKIRAKPEGFRIGRVRERRKKKCMTNLEK